MANCESYNCNDDLGSHLLNTCGVPRQGGADAMLLMYCGAVLSDPSDGAEINALIAAGDAVLITEVNVSWAVPSPIPQESNVPGRADTVINYDRSGTLVDDNVNSSNIDFYNGVGDGREFEDALVFECCNEGDNKVHRLGAALTFSGGNQMPNSDDVRQDFQYTFSWKRKDNPSIHNFPVGVTGL